MTIWLWDRAKPFVDTRSFASSGGVLKPTMATFNPADANSLVVTGFNVYRYFKLSDSMQMRATHMQLTKKDMNFS